MAIKHRIKLKNDRGRGTRDATGAPLDLSDNAKASDELPASDGESARRSVPADDMNKENEEKFYETDRPRFEEHDEKEYAKHCRKFFKGEVE